MNHKQLIKFILAGILNTLVYYVLYSGFLFVNFDYRLSVLFATMIGVLFSFKTFGKYVFNNQNKKLLYKFIFIYIILYLVNIAIISIFEIFILNYYISGLLATLCCAILSFGLNKWYVFKI